LGRLDSAHIVPIRRIETASLGPTPEMFRIGHEMATLVWAFFFAAKAHGNQNKTENKQIA